VIVNDALGIASQLESEMEDLIANYACEWKKVVESPELRAQFRHFVNSEASDDTLVFAEVRGQKNPENWKS
jgi:nitrite reductase (NADH) large subunit